ncbi:DUF354 domain-containing protein [Helicobacter cetorum]|uniref:DUF354 domain-containing protein n=1 Tax=Helicobacter cetorum TaxID=138563 RepID=UPI000CF0598A|nr:DUF354 domain-containing protein [Helicobacter cetorum]
MGLILTKPLIWLDILDPKYALFFQAFLPYFQEMGELLITTRKDTHYNECVNILEMFNTPYIAINAPYSASLKDKYLARLEREKAFLKLFETRPKPSVLITGVSVEAVSVAYALNIPIAHFSDTPMFSDTFNREFYTKQARLSLPLSSLIIYPFVVPKKCYTHLGIPKDRLIKQDFLDASLCIEYAKKNPTNLLKESLGLKNNAPIILAREEEYKASYVNKKHSLFYETMEFLGSKDCEVLIVPRYDKEELKKRFKNFKNICVLEKTYNAFSLYALADIFIGAGGTMTLESCYLGIPTLSLRSISLFHDKFLINHNLLKHADGLKEAQNILENFLSIKDYSSCKKQTHLKAQKHYKAKNLESKIAQICKKISTLIK